MKRVIKVIISVLLLVTIILSVWDCRYLFVKPKGVEMDGVTYTFDKAPQRKAYAIKHIDDINNPQELKHIIIPDFINGYKVRIVGEYPVLWGMPELGINYSHTERIYFPWTVDIFTKINLGLQDSDVLKYFVFPTNNKSLYYFEQNILAKPMIKLIINNHLYEYLELEYWSKRGYHDEDFLPANISYMFNHAENPNDGYFFIDLIEESEKLMKPPYDPRREGYTFLGWYKDEGCTEAWDFENDEVEIHFDEEGNRIYEEIKLYAGWEKENWWDWFRK
ncbi:MAG: InlB B-repeat-containing protein [Clostridia bacterium]|nr:InlB B-repeat-containing protein [Clostridia bacterium]